MPCFTGITGICKCSYQFLSQFDTDHPAAETHEIHVVMLYALSCGIAFRDQSGPDVFYLIGCNGCAYSASANGNAFLQSNGLPMVLIAGGTGFSYTYSILQEHLNSGDKTPLTLYWGGKHAADLYLADKLTELAIIMLKEH